MIRNHSLAYMSSMGATQLCLPRDDSEGELAEALRQCNKLHAGDSTLTFEKGTGNEGSSLKMDVVTTPGSLLTEKHSFEQYRIMLDVRIADPCSPNALNASIDVLGSALANAVSREHRHYRGKKKKMYKLVNLAFSS